MRSVAFAHLEDDALFDELLRRRAAREDFRPLLGALVERWRDPARTVVRRIQGSYMRGSPEDAEDVFQDAVGKLLTRGLDQFRGLSEVSPGKVASPKAFFLRIVKHVAIDRYRRQREELYAPGAGAELDSPEEGSHMVAQAIEASARRRERADSSEEYWAAFERLRAEHPNEAAAWHLYHHEDVVDHVHCARVLNISVANSYKRVSRAQAWLKLYLLELRRTEVCS